MRKSNKLQVNNPYLAFQQNLPNNKYPPRNRQLSPNKKSNNNSKRNNCINSISSNTPSCINKNPFSKSIQLKNQKYINKRYSIQSSCQNSKQLSYKKNINTLMNSIDQLKRQLKHKPFSQQQKQSSPIYHRQKHDKINSFKSISNNLSKQFVINDNNQLLSCQKQRQQKQKEYQQYKQQQQQYEEILDCPTSLLDAKNYPDINFSTKTIKFNKQTQYYQNYQQFDDFPSLSSINFIDQDDRQKIDTRNIVKNKTKFPYSVIGKIVSEFHIHSNYKKNKFNKSLNPQKYQGVTKYGMACLIGPGIAVTDAHVVSDRETGKIADNVYFYLNHTTQKDIKMNKKKILTFKVEKVLIHPQYFTKQKNQTQRYDIAILKLEQSLQLPTQFIRIKWEYSFDKYKKNELKFITSKLLQQPNTFQLLQSDNIPCGEIRSLLLYKNTTTFGDSGSPVLFMENVNGLQKYYLVGLHKGSVPKANCCILLNSYLKNTKDIFNEIIQSQHLLIKKLKQLGNYQLSFGQIETKLKTLQERNQKLQKYRELMIEKEKSTKNIKYQQNRSKSIKKQTSTQLSSKNSLQIENIQQQLIIDKLEQNIKYKQQQIRTLNDELKTQLRYRQQLQEIIKKQQAAAKDFQQFYNRQRQSKQQNTQLLNIKNIQIDQMKRQIKLLQQQKQQLAKQNQQKSIQISRLFKLKFQSIKSTRCLSNQQQKSYQTKENKKVSQQNNQSQSSNYQAGQQQEQISNNQSYGNLNLNNKCQKQILTTKRKLLDKAENSNDKNQNISKQSQQNQQLNDQRKSCLDKFYQCFQNLFKSKPKIIPMKIDQKKYSSKILENTQKKTIKAKKKIIKSLTELEIKKTNKTKK